MSERISERCSPIISSIMSRRAAVSCTVVTRCAEARIASFFIVVVVAIGAEVDSVGVMVDGGVAMDKLPSDVPGSAAAPPTRRDGIAVTPFALFLDAAMLAAGTLLL